MAIESSTPANQGGETMQVAEIDASDLQTRELNDRLREMLLSGVGKVKIRNVCGQRYIGTRLYTPQRLMMEIEIFGTPGNDLAAFLYGHKITVHGNAQDGVGNTMDAGEIVVKGRAGDVLGFSMRGGEIYVREGCGYRTALHMKEYEDKRPVLVVGGTSQDFLGEYMAGGIVILLDLQGLGHNGPLHWHRHAWRRDLSERHGWHSAGGRTGGHLAYRRCRSAGSGSICLQVSGAISRDRQKPGGDHELKVRPAHAKVKEALQQSLCLLKSPEVLMENESKSH